MSPAVCTGWAGRRLSCYLTWRATPAGRAVYAEALKRARALESNDLRRAGFSMIWGAIRYDVAVGGRIAGRSARDLGIRLNPNHKDLLAAELSEDFPELEPVLREGWGTR